MNFLEILGLIFIGCIVTVFVVFIISSLKKIPTSRERLIKERYFEETGKDVK